MRASLPMSIPLAEPRRSRFAGMRLVDLLTLGRSRKQLRDLDARMLRDIGLTRIAAERESERPFWDVPTTWRR